MGWVNLAMMAIVSVALDIPDIAALVLCFALATAYSTMAGLWGVVITDFFQFGLTLGGAVILAVFAVEAVGGIAGMQNSLGDIYGSTDAALAMLPAESAAWMPAITMTVYLGVNWWASWYLGAEPGGGGYVAQRIFAARSERDSVLATLWFNIAHYAVRPWPWILVALASTILYPGLEDPKEGYALAVMGLLPSGLTGLVLAGFVAAYMSTISTQLNWGASYLVNDLYGRFIRPDLGERELVKAARISTAGLMVTSLVVTYFLTSIEGTWRFLLAIGAGTGLVLILRWYWWRINAWSEISAMIASLVVSVVLWFGVGLDPDDPIQWAWTMLATVGASTVVWIAVTFLTRPEDDEVLRAFYLRVRPAGRGWRPIVETVGLPGEPVDGGPLNWTNWVAGVISVYSTLFGVGQLIFGATGRGVLLLFVAVVCSRWIGRNLRPSCSSMAPVPGIAS
jgi:SSS family solute:Na+ symporter